ncbi:MAG TPA: class I SAM-dependent methyltransferase [Acidimicrobiales bacterium]|nr:class I SAM-dependent methyltransferase [Acidimicrobiales bacterium]
MSTASAAFFAAVQRAPAYRAVLSEVVRAAPPGGPGRLWLDVGCGPGLVARLAAERGYDSLGVDTDAAMIAIARRRRTAARFQRLDAESPLPAADVVSATSLLCQVPEPARTLTTLWAAVRPGGMLIVLETSSLMTVDRLRSASAHGDPWSRCVMSAWARARAGRAVDPRIFEVLPVPPEGTELLDGAVDLWIIRRGETA